MTRRCVAVLLVLVPACSQVFGLETPARQLPHDAAPVADQQVDVPPSRDAATCFGTGLVTLCLAAPPTGPLVLTGGTIDTDGAVTPCQPLASASQPDLCVLAADSITVEGNAQAVGSRPLVLVATNITILASARLSATSRTIMGVVGAGSRTCSGGTAPTSGTSSSGGGAGGSFGGVGGDGTAGVPAGEGGKAASATPSPATLVGGCQGQQGASTVGGAGGRGGGALALIGAAAIKIDGLVVAGGGGGLGGPSTADVGGGGGGSGGMIVLDAPAVTLSNMGAVFANGGGGGEGGDLSSAIAGIPGQESTAPTVAGVGGSGASAAGNGGDGSAGNSTGGVKPSAPACSSCGGGGGGGGAGIIKVFPAQSFGANVSPPAT